jgi:hypothetical protein
LTVTTASPARALTASLLDYVVEEVSTAAYRTRASRSTSDFRFNRPGDWSGWGMPALEVISYELLSYGYILMATLMDNLLILVLTQF